MHTNPFYLPTIPGKYHIYLYLPLPISTYLPRYLSLYVFIYLIYLEEYYHESKLLHVSSKPIWFFPSSIVSLLVLTNSLRGDRLGVEKEDLDLAGKEKHRLEEKQRAERRERETKGEEYVQKYFKVIK